MHLSAGMDSFCPGSCIDEQCVFNDDDTLLGVQVEKRVEKPIDSPVKRNVFTEIREESEIKHTLPTKKVEKKQQVTNDRFPILTEYTKNRELPNDARKCQKINLGMTELPFTVHFSNHHKGQYKQRSSTVNDSVERKRAESTSNDKVLQPGNDRLLLLSNDDGKYRSIPPVKLHSDEARERKNGVSSTPDEFMKKPNNHRNVVIDGDDDVFHNNNYHNNQCYGHYYPADPFGARTINMDPDYYRRKNVELRVKCLLGDLRASNASLNELQHRYCKLEAELAKSRRATESVSTFRIEDRIEPLRVHWRSNTLQTPSPTPYETGRLTAIANVTGSGVQPALRRKRSLPTKKDAEKSPFISAVQTGDHTSFNVDTNRQMVFNIIKQRHPEFLDVAKLIFQGHRHGSDGLLLRFREALEKRRLLLVQRMTRLQDSLKTAFGERRDRLSRQIVDTHRRLTHYQRKIDQLDEAQDAQQHVRVAAFVDEPVATTGRRVSTAAPNEVNELRVLYKVFEQ